MNKTVSKVLRFCFFQAEGMKHHAKILMVAYYGSSDALKFQSAGSQRVILSKLFVSSKVMTSSSRHFPKFATLTVNGLNGLE